MKNIRFSDGGRGVELISPQKQVKNQELINSITRMCHNTLFVFYNVKKFDFCLTIYYFLCSTLSLNHFEIKSYVQLQNISFHYLISKR